MMKITGLAEKKNWKKKKPLGNGGEQNTAAEQHYSFW